MGFVFDSLITEVACVALAIIIVFTTCFVRWSHGYWERRNLPFLKFENPLFAKETPGFRFKSFYDRLKAQGHKHGGLYSFTSPIYLPIDPELIKNVLQKDFSHFADRSVYYNEKDDPLSAHMFALEGDRWRNLRVKLTPTFTSGKMKMMFETLVKCSYPLKEAMDEYCRSGEAVDVKEMVGRFTTDIIGSTAFGLDCNSFESPDAEFRKYGKKAFAFTKLDFIKIILCMTNPKIGRFLRLRLTAKDSSDFFINVVKDAIKYREDNNVTRKDMLQLLLELKTNQGLTLEEIAAQAFLFFVAGFETSATTMTFCLFELAQNLDIQQKVRDEIIEVLETHDGKITYDAITEMKYMGQVIDETLRKYPPLTVLDRKCVKEYPVPNTNVVLEKGTMVFISPLGLHHDPEYYPEPEKFDPERFNEENKKLRHPFTYLPFGEGPRICIGLRFGVMQTKVGLASLLKDYKFSLSSKTKIPLKLDPYTVMYTIKEPVWLDIEMIQ